MAKKKQKRKDPPPPPDGDAFYKSIAAHLKALREAAALSRQALGNLVGVSVDTVYAWEVGRSTPSVKYYPKLAHALGLKHAHEVLPVLAVA